ncbi:MAG TPA: RyR domain-containing protein, partial [Blastocatellia bacterium]
AEPVTDWSAPLLEFSEEEIDEMARLEHKRCMEERKREGWTYGSKSEKHDTAPCLIEWEHLPEEEKESIRISVRDIPAFLARAGFQMYRLK